VSEQRSPRAPRTLPFLSGTAPRVLAHRGLALDTDENTLDAFRAAVAAGADIIETDVRATRDGVAVLFHDDALKVSNATGISSLRRIRDLLWTEVQLVVLPRGGRIPSLAEALAALPGVKLNIDLKSSDAVKPTVTQIRDAGAADRVLLTSFSEARRRAATKAVPGVATSASAALVIVAVLGARLGWGAVVRWALGKVDALQIPEQVLRITTTRPAMISQFHEAGVEVHVWTINDDATMRRLRDAGVDGVVTDRTDVARLVFPL
jgi:glycerophosphoryl diester phosphodiesterase